MKKGFLLILCMLIFLPMAFAGGQQGTTEEETITLKWQVWVTPNMDRAYYDEAAAGFTAENPNIKIEIIETSAAVDSSAANFLRNRLISGDVPDLWSNVGATEFIDAGHVWALPENDPVFQRINSPKAIAYNGKIYSLNNAAQPQGATFYNKKLWEQAGLTDADIPATFAEFEAVCATLKAAGITPIVTGGEWVPFALLNWLIGPEIGKAHPDFWSEYRNGDIRFTDPEFVSIFEWVDGLVKKGYFNKGALSIGYAQLEQEFLNGKAAMYPMGTWFTAAEMGAEKDWECGAFINPSYDASTNFIHGGGYGASWIYSGSDHPEEAFEFMKWYLMDSEFAVRSIEVDGLYSNTNPPAVYDMSPLQKEVQGLVSKADFASPQLTSNLGGAPPAGINDILGTVMEAILIQSYTDLTEEIQKIDDFIVELEGL